MAKTIFFSWQADISEQRNFLKDVLEEVSKKIASGSDVEESSRGMEVDSDTQGVAGQPPIAETIFKKIDAAAVFIGDMTFTGKRLDNRPTPNPNVLIEYGWALKSLKYERVICVMNDAYGEPSHTSLPFDLSHLRWPIRFNLPHNAPSEVIKEEKKKLVTILSKAIPASIATLPAIPTERPIPFPMNNAKEDRARFRDPNLPLGINDESAWVEETPKEVYLSKGPAMWLRLMPLISPNKTWPSHELKKYATKGNNTMNLTPLLSISGSYGGVRGDDGFGMYYSSQRKGNSNSIETKSVAFAFDTGEIWAIDTAYLDDGNILPFIEDIYVEHIQLYARFLKDLGIEGSYKWIAGVLGVKGRHLQYPDPPGRGRVGPGPVCVANFIVEEGEYDGGDKESAEKALLPFFKKIFDQCGLARPDYL